MSSGEHLSEELVQRFADLAVDGVSPSVVAHAESCEACSARIAEVALMAFSVQEALERDATAIADVAAERRPSPAVPLLVAILVAGAASLPLASEWPSRWTHLKLAWDGAARMLAPLWEAASSPTAQLAATAAALILCAVVAAPLIRRTEVEVKS